MSEPTFDFNRLFAAVVAAAGGSVTITDEDYANAQPVEVIRNDNGYSFVTIGDINV